MQGASMFGNSLLFYIDLYYDIYNISRKPLNCCQIYLIKDISKHSNTHLYFNGAILTGTSMDPYYVES